VKKELALYKTIENELLEKITTGYYKPDDMIPTELELAKLYQVSRVTIRKATDNLVAKGLLVRTAGFGTVVKPTSLAHKSIEHLSFTEEIKLQGKTPRSEVITFTVIEATPQIAKILQIGEREMVYFFERVRYCDDDVILFERTHMSIRKFPDLSISHLEKSKFWYIENVRGLKIDISVHDVIPILPSARFIELFKIDQYTPIIKVNNLTYLANGEVMDYTEQYLNSSKYHTKYVRVR